MQLRTAILHLYGMFMLFEVFVCVCVCVCVEASSASSALQFIIRGFQNLTEGTQPDLKRRMATWPR